MPTIPSYRSRETFQPAGQPDVSHVFDQIGDVAEGISGEIEKAKKEREAVKAKFDRLSQKNEVDSSTLSAKRDMLLFQEEFNQDPLKYNDEEYGNKISEITSRYADNISSLEGQEKFKLNMMIPQASYGIEARAVRNEALIIEGQNNTIGELNDLYADPLRDQKFVTFWEDEERQELFSPDKREKLSKETLKDWTRREAEDNPEAVLNDFKDKNSLVNRAFDNKERKSLIKEVENIIKQNEAISDVEEVITNYEGQKAGIKILQGSGGYAEKHNKISSMNIDDKIKEALLKDLNSNMKIDAELNIDVYSDLIGDMDTIDIYKSTDATTKESKTFLRTVIELKNKALKARSLGQLNDAKYDEFIEKIDKKVARKERASIEKVGKEDQWFLGSDLTYKEIKAGFMNAFNNDTFETNKAMMNYFEAVDGKELYVDDKAKIFDDIILQANNKRKADADKIRQNYSIPKKANTVTRKEVFETLGITQADIDETKKSGYTDEQINKLLIDKYNAR